MTVKELAAYLAQFDPEEHVRTLVLDLDSRLAYRPDGYQLMTDAGIPVLLLELADPAPLDEIVEEVDAE